MEYSEEAGYSQRTTVRDPVWRKHGTRAYKYRLSCKHKPGDRNKPIHALILQGRYRGHLCTVIRINDSTTNTVLVQLKAGKAQVRIQRSHLNLPRF